MIKNLDLWFFVAVVVAIPVVLGIGAYAFDAHQKEATRIHLEQKPAVKYFDPHCSKTPFIFVYNDGWQGCVDYPTWEKANVPDKTPTYAK